jgi:hypothetical protein
MDKPIALECMDNDGVTHRGWMIFCPACKSGHMFDERWTFNGDVHKPTFRASMMVRSTRHEPPITAENFAEWKRAPWPQHDVKTVCHSYVTDGQIQYLGDCTHELAGKTVPLEPF